jgi:ABC-type phosphate transport system permease subunit
MFTACIASARFVTFFAFTEPVMALTYHLYRLSGDVTGPEAVVNAAGTALALLLIVLMLYGIAFIIRTRYEKKKQW